MGYTIHELHNTTMSVKDFLEHEKEIPYWKISAGFHYITLSELREKYYDKTIYFYNEPKDYGYDEDGTHTIIDRLYAEVKL